MRKIYKGLLVVLFGFPMSILAQEDVSGTVTESSGMPIPGVNVVVKGTSNGSVTDFNGEYSLAGVNINDTLSYSYLGFETREIVFTGQNTIDVSLEQSAAVLSEVVLIGYGSTETEDVTGAIETVTPEDFNRGVVTSPDQLLQGRTPGVSIIDNGGAPGEGSTIRIRGGSSINASNNPLIIVDNVPLNNPPGGTRNFLNSINPNDIQSFTILKDASATAIYGFRASNGVIIITTKKGKNTGGELNFTYDGNVSLATIDRKTDVLSSDQFREYVTQNGNEQQIALLGEANTDWQDVIFQDAYTTSHNLSVAGGYEYFNFRASAGYLSQEGLLITDKLDRTTLNLNAGINLFDKHLNININNKLAIEEYNYANGGAIGAAVSFDPTQPVYQENAFGNYFQWLNASGNPLTLAGENPLALIEQQDNQGLVYRSLGNIEFDYKFHFLPELRAVLNLGYEIASSQTENRISNEAISTVQADGTNLGSYSEFGQKRENLLLDFYLNYNKDLEGFLDSNIDLTAGYSYQKYLDSGYNFDITSAGVENDVPFDNPNIVLLGFFGRANYSFLDNRYVLTGTFRRDASSRFLGFENQWTNSPSGAIAWNIHREGFLRNSTTINQLKLRASYGETPQQDIGDATPSLPRYAISNQFSQYQMGYDENGNPIFVNTGLALAYNPTLQWEKTKSYNIGVDFGLFDSRIIGSADVYRKDTEDLLFYATLPSGNLSNADDVNLGDLRNEGIELALEVAPVRTDDVTWTIGGNITFQRSNIEELYAAENPNFEGFYNSGAAGSDVNIQTVGYAPGAFWVFEQVYDANGRPVEDAYVDRNGDNIINERDRYIYQKPAADVFYGFNTQFRYKNFDFSMFWRGSYGNYNYNFVDADRAYGAQVLRFNDNLFNATTDLLESGFVNGGVERYASDYYIQEASFLKLDNISIAYTFESLFSEDTNLRLYGTVRNVLTITDYDGIDPEIPGGYDANIYPRPRTFQVGMNLEF